MEEQSATEITTGTEISGNQLVEKSAADLEQEKETSVKRLVGKSAEVLPAEKEVSLRPLLEKSAAALQKEKEISVRRSVEKSAAGQPTDTDISKNPTDLSTDKKDKDKETVLPTEKISVGNIDLEQTVSFSRRNTSYIEEEAVAGEAEQEKRTSETSRVVEAIVINRDEYLTAFRELNHERNQLQIKNTILHRRLADWYRKRKMEHVLKPIDNSADLEEKYGHKLLAYEQLKEAGLKEITDIKCKVALVAEHYRIQLNTAEEKFQELQDHERNTGTGLIYSKLGKPISNKTVARLMDLQSDKTRRASDMMLRYIRVRNAVAEQENIIRSLEKIAPGLYVAKYEQLRVDNLNLVNKIEERDDELVKNRNRCTQDIQILGHIREKMDHTDEYIEFIECDLGDVEMDCQRAREQLGEAKTRRDRLRIAREQERRKAGLMTKKDLLYDFQEAEQQLERLKERKEYLKQKIERTNMELRLCRKRLTVDKTGEQDFDDFWM